jgi:hypothetical protein
LPPQIKGIRILLTSQTIIGIFDKRKELIVGNEGREGIKRESESNGLVCDCGEKVYEVGKEAIENQPNYNKYFEYLECTNSHKLFYL